MLARDNRPKNPGTQESLRAERDARLSRVQKYVCTCDSQRRGAGRAPRGRQWLAPLARGPGPTSLPAVPQPPRRLQERVGRVSRQVFAASVPAAAGPPRACGWLAAHELRGHITRSGPAHHPERTVHRDQWTLPVHLLRVFLQSSLYSLCWLEKSRRWPAHRSRLSTPAACMWTACSEDLRSSHLRHWSADDWRRSAAAPPGPRAPWPAGPEYWRGVPLPLREPPLPASPASSASPHPCNMKGCHFPEQEADRQTHDSADQARCIRNVTALCRSKCSSCAGATGSRGAMADSKTTAHPHLSSCGMAVLSSMLSAELAGGALTS